LLAQDGLINVELGLELRDELIDAVLVRWQSAVLLEHLFEENAGHDGLKVGIFDARRLLELCMGLGIGGDQLWARAERCEIAADGARLVELEAVVLLLDRERKENAHQTAAVIGKGERRRTEM
jgi:hypothetical protein